MGRTSNLTVGRISAFELETVHIISVGNEVKLNGSIEITSDDESPFSMPGDGGAVVMSDAGVVIGLVVGVGRSFSIACPLAPALEALGLELLPSR